MGGRRHTPELVARVCELYQAGYGMIETARLAGLRRHSSVQKILARAGIRARPAGQYSPRTQERYPQGKNGRGAWRGVAPPRKYGDDHPGWKGDQCGYMAAHQRVWRTRGKARDYGCSRCGTTDPDRQYHWANLTGNYADINDYAPMCQSCHGLFDSARRKEAAR